MSLRAGELLSLEEVQELCLLNALLRAQHVPMHVDI